MYFFKDYPDPLSIEAQNREQADYYIQQELNKLYGIVEPMILEDVKVTTPVYGVTEKEEKKIVYVWAGFDNSNTGWLTKEEFNKLKIIE